jgi:orotate phosphoribosyltransferase
LNEDEILAELRRSGAILEGHFVLSSGRHSDAYVEKFRALERPELAVALGEEIAARFKDREVDVVLSPAVGAVVIGFTTALALQARFVFAERVSGAMVLRRGFEIKKGERVLLVEDVVTTGASAAEVAALASPGDLVGIGAVVDRSSSPNSGLPMPIDALVRFQADSWPQDACPLCARGVPTATPGSRYLISGG